MNLPIFTTVDEKRLAYDYEQVHSLKDAVKILKIGNLLTPTIPISAVKRKVPGKFSHRLNGIGW